MIFGEAIPTLRELTGAIKKLPPAEHADNIQTVFVGGANLVFTRVEVQTEKGDSTWVWVYRGAVAVTDKVL